MRVLLLGEFSSLHKYLKEGLQEIPGIEVTLASHGDGWKKIGGADVVLPEYCGGGIKGKIRLYLQFVDCIKKMKGFDVVQFISPNVFPSLIGKWMFKCLKKNNKCISLVAAGNDYAVVRAYESGKYDYHPFDYDKTQFNKYKSRKISALLMRKCAIAIEKGVDIIIPSLYEYTIGYETEKLYKVIPFPINVEGIAYSDNICSDKVVLFHGLNKEKAKGTPFIREALERLKKNYPDDVEVIIDGHMPFDKYTKVLEKTNVVIDQCCTYGYGINACIAMAQGKVVMSGCRTETLQAFGMSKTPMYLAKPDVDYLYQQMEKVVLNKEKITELGKLSREYVVGLHDYKVVANEYINAWRSTERV